MNLQKEYIYETSKKLIEDLHILTNNEIEEKYKDFKEKLPKLYEMCIKNEPNTLKELSILLNIREERKENKKTEIESNVQVSEYMAKKYVYPITGEPTLEQKKIALKKIVKDAVKKENETKESRS